MSGQEVNVTPIVADKQSSELVNPGEGAFGSKAAFVNFLVEEAFSSSFWLFALTFVFRNVRA